MGVLFLGNDGVYAISGGLDGGSTLNISNISNGIGTLLEKRSVDVLGQACATYSPKMKEWQCYFPAFGTDNRIMGIVYHVEGGYWSQRSGFGVGAVTTDFDGNVIFGNNTGQVGSIVDEVQNMAPKTVKTLVTRPDEKTKMVFIDETDNDGRHTQ